MVIIEKPSDALTPLTRDLKKAAETLSSDEARYLVDSYYQMQGDRIRAQNQLRSMTAEEKEPHELFLWLNKNQNTLENRIKSALDSYSNGQALGIWARQVVGIGPVIAAGLLAHIDISKAETAGGIWSFAGLDPTKIWAKGQKRPYNASLKTLCWKIGESFVKVKGNEADVYGHVYEDYRLYIEAKNERGDYKEQAEGYLAAKNYGKATESYKAYAKGQLPKAQIYARAKRRAVKLFLAHYHHVGYELLHGTQPPKPYVIEHMAHAHYMAPPNWPM